MTISGSEICQIQGEGITPAKLVWRRYKLPYPGMLEAFLDMNPQVLEGLATSPFLPVGAVVRIPIDRGVLSGRPQQGNLVTLYGKSPTPALPAPTTVLEIVQESGIGRF